MLKFFHPRSTPQFLARNLLLQRSLRPDPLPFPIELEYPLVLSADGAPFSYCVEKAGVLIAHANLWPRYLGKTKIGFVGNVATDARFRGQGVMRALFDELTAEADRQDLAALVLWSDLDQFYQKLGFTSFGNERRYEFHAANLAHLTPPFVRLSAPTLELMTKLLERRYPVACTAGRSPAEFLRLLSIPATVVMLLGSKYDPTGYAVIGKGADMVGVIHEWGARSPDELLAAVAGAAELTGLSEILVLAPPKLPLTWNSVLAPHLKSTSEHAVGHMWARSAEIKARLEGSFIWGLDSI